MDELLKVQGLRAGYGVKEIVHGVDFALAAGEMAVLLGANGSGKSTLLRAVCGLLPAAGRCMLAGEDLWALSARRRAQRVGYLAQKSGDGPALSALEVVLLGYSPVLGLLQRPDKAQRAAALGALERLGAGALAGRDLEALSQGQRQLVLLARTLVRQPRLLVLDEPDSALDGANRQRILRRLKEYAKESGAGILLCSHDANIALRYADRLLLLEEGRLYGDVAMNETGAAQLAAALGRIYGPVEVLRHRGRWLMAEEDAE